jgi:SAM-dependent methyltransferase
MKPIDCLNVYEDAAFYDLEFATRDHEIPFYRRLALQAKGPVLEIACGTGRITIPIAEDGVDITGIDISEPMLERAKAGAHARSLSIDWHLQDCRDIRLERKFDLIFSATNAMQHLHDVDSVCAFLQSAGRVLSPDGLLALDVFQPNLAKLSRDPSIRYHHKTIPVPNEAPVEVEATSHYCSDTQLLHFDLFYSQAGFPLRTKSVNMRCFFPEELRALCLLNGFQIEQRYGDYDQRSFDATSPKQILLLKRLQRAEADNHEGTSYACS